MNSESNIKVIAKEFAHYSRRAFLNNKSIDDLIDDFLAILALKVDMCLIDLEHEDEDDSQTEEFITMTKTLKKVLKLISKAKQNKIKINTLSREEINEATEDLINYLTKESTKSKYVEEIIKYDYTYDVRESFINVANNYFINKEQGQELFKEYELITNKEDEDKNKEIEDEEADNEDENKEIEDELMTNKEEW